MHIKPDRYGRTEKFDYKEAYLARREAAKERNRTLHVPTRRDFTTPRQHVKLMLKAAAEGFVWPSIA
jgi:hypothetical protein